MNARVRHGHAAMAWIREQRIVADPGFAVSALVPHVVRHRARAFMPWGPVALASQVLTWCALSLSLPFVATLADVYHRGWPI